jgi:hypothetical protein
MLSELIPFVAVSDAPCDALHLTAVVSDKTLTHWQDKDLYQPTVAQFGTVEGWHIPVHGRHPLSCFLPQHSVG